MGLIRTPKMGLTNEEKYILVLQWMYVSEGEFNSGQEWRKGLVEFIGKILEIDLEKMETKLDNIDNKE